MRVAGRSRRQDLARTSRARRATSRRRAPARVSCGREPLQGRETWQQGYELVKRAFPDLTIRVDDLVAADDKVALRLTLSGTHQGEFRGIPATGRTISYVSHEFYRVADGLVAGEWICSDIASLFRRLA